MTQNTKDAGASLKPCPFCGDTEFRVETGDVQPDNYHTGSVVCISCDARGPEPEEWLGSKGEASAAARECWNRRSALAPSDTAAVAWQVRRADGRIDGAPIQWENCTKELYDATLSTGRYAGYENGPRCEVRALYAQPVAPTAEQAEGVPQIKPRLLNQLRRFNECCEDSEAGGHDVDKEDMHSLAELGAVRPAPGGRHYMTDFGHYLLAAPQSSQPVEAGETLTDEQMLDAIKSACNFDGAGVERWRTEALIVGRAVERAALAKRSAVVLDDERAAFEADYAKVWNAAMKENGWNEGHTADDVKDLREGNTYGEGRDYLNARWEGWQARAASPQATATQPALTDEQRAQLAAIAAERAKTIRSAAQPASGGDHG